MAEPVWELIFAVSTHNASGEHLDQLAAVWTDTALQLEGRIASVADLERYNVSVFKSERVINWQYMTHVRPQSTFILFLCLCFCHYM